MPENMEVDNQTAGNLLKEKKLKKLCNGNGIEANGGEDSMDTTEKSDDLNGIDESAKDGKLNSVRENGEKDPDEKKVASNDECLTNGEDKENDVDHETESKIEGGTEEEEKDDIEEDDDIDDDEDKNKKDEVNSDEKNENCDTSGRDKAEKDNAHGEEQLNDESAKKEKEDEDIGLSEDKKDAGKDQSDDSIVEISEDDKAKTSENTEDETGAEKKMEEEEKNPDASDAGKEENVSKESEKEKNESDPDKEENVSKESEKEKNESNADKEENVNKESDAKSSKESGTKEVDLTSPAKTSEPPVETSPPKPSNVTTALKPPAPSIQIRPMSSLLFDVGMDLARQQVYKDLIRIQTKKLSMDKLDDKEGRQLGKLKEAYDELVSKNDPFATEYNQCDICGYKSELDNVLENHKEYGHGQNINMFHCTLCDFETKVQHQFILHMEHTHKRRGRVVVRHAFFVCPFCPFEHNAKNSYNKHILKCERLFKMNRNLEPTPADCDIPIKLPKPVESRTMPTRNQPRPPPPHISQLGKRSGIIPVAPTPVRPTPVSTVTAAQQALQQSLQAARTLIRPPQPQPVAPVAQAAPPQMVQVGSQWYHMILLNGQRFLTPVVPGVPAPNLGAPNVMSNAQIIRQPQPPLVRFPGKANSAKKTPNASAFEICEICGGFVKDRDSLRIHFYWAHKVDIHKDMFLRSKPNLICERCDFRCWTVQGLARHKNTAHKEHTKDKGKSRPPFYCMLCRPTPELLHTETFWLHMSANHSVNPANIFNQDHCVVCGVANIGVPRALETHMLNIHGHLFTDELVTLAKKIAEAGNPKALIDSTKAASRQSSEGPIKKMKEKHTKGIPDCPTCEASFSTMSDYTSHCLSVHAFKCSRCSKKYLSRAQVQKHFTDTHKNDRDACPICSKTIQIGRPLVRHMKSEHMKDCSVVIPKLPQSEVDKRMEKYIEQWGTPGKLKTPAKTKRKISTESPVIILDVTPQKKRRRSSTSSKLSTTEQEVQPSTKTSTKEVIEVDGEEILVEIQQSDDEGDSSLEISTNSKSKDTENVQEISDSSANSSGIVVELNDKSDSEIMIDEREDSKSNSENNEENNSEKADKDLEESKEDHDKNDATEADEAMEVADD